MSITGNYGDYSSVISSSGPSAIETGFVGAFLVIWIISLILSLAVGVLMIISMWKIFTQNNKPGWYSLIPFLNTWTLFTLVDVAGWWSLIPFANGIFAIIVSYKLAIKYGRSTGFAVATIFFPYVCFPILAFSKKKVEVQTQPEVVNEEVREEPKEEEKKETKTTTKKKTTKKVESKEKFCSECGTKMAGDAAFCPNCGAKTK